MRLLPCVLVFALAACSSTPSAPADAGVASAADVTAPVDAADDDAGEEPDDAPSAADVVTAPADVPPEAGAGLDLALLAGTWRGMASDSITATLTFGAPPSTSLTAVTVQTSLQKPPCVNTFRLQGTFIYSEPASLAPMFDNMGTHDVTDCLDPNQNVMGGVVTSPQRAQLEGVLSYDVVSLTQTTLLVRHETGAMLTYTRQ